MKIKKRIRRFVQWLAILSGRKIGEIRFEWRSPRVSGPISGLVPFIIAPEEVFIVHVAKYRFDGLAWRFIGDRDYKVSKTLNGIIKRRSQAT